MNFTTEHLRMLGQAERDMDAGKIPFVVWEGGRMSVIQEVMDELELKSGQTINGVLFEAILQRSIALVQAKIALKKAQVPS